MYNSKNEFEMKKTISKDDGKSFFHMPDMDLSSSVPSVPEVSRKEVREPEKEAVSRMKTSFKTGDSIRMGSSFRTTIPPSSEGTIAKVEPVLKAKSTDAAHLEYEKFKKRRDELTDVFSQTADIMQRLNMIQLEKKLSDLRDKIKRDTFKIQIVGNFKNGKSTFINSFLGESVLPAYALPCTAVINEVKYGTEKRAVVHFKNPLPKTLPSELSPAVLKHINTHLPGSVPPIEVDYDKIEDYVVIPVGKDPRDMLLESPYERVELFWPLELLKNGIEIIDSPGLNEHTTRTKVTMDFLTKSDAIIFVLNATMLCSRDEMTFIEKSLHANGFKDLFFVVNRFDMIPDAEKKRIMSFAKKNLVSMTNIGEKGIFFVSAKTALDARMADDKKALEMSGMPAFEKILSLFLTKKKGSMKLLSPARAVLNFLQEEALKKILPQHREKLSLSSNEVGKDCDLIQEDIKTLERKKEIFSNIIHSDIKQLDTFFAPMAKNHIIGVANAVSYWLQEFEPSQKLGFTLSRERTMIVIHELMEHIRFRLEENNGFWCQKEVLPQLSERKGAVFSSVKKQVNDLIKAGEKPKEDNPFGDAYKRFNARFAATSGTGEEVSWKTAIRVTSAPLLLLMSSFSSGDVKEKIYASFSKNSMWSTSTMTRLKSIVMEEVVLGIKNSSNEYASSFVGEITQYFNEEAEKALAPIDNEIASLQNKFDFMSADTGMKKADIEAKKQELEKTDVEIQQLCENLEKYIESFKKR